ncbi:MAG: hypothetical protein EBV03_11425 [Proteobacteria bacterium]|nr:hypothetical protein [Pseudomonadota bacterium]
MKKRPSPEPARDAYLPLQEAIDRLQQTDSARTRQSEALQFFVNSQKEVGKLAHDLSRIGLRRFASLAVGTHAIALETTEGQIIRIEDHINAGHGNRAEVHEQLQPIQSGVVKREGSPYFYYEILPKIDTNVSAEDARKYASHVTGKGYKLDHADHADGNLGYLPDGTVVGVDKNTLRPPASKRIVQADKSRWLVKAQPDQQSIFTYMEPGFISKQEKFFPAIADGRMRGVLTDSDIKRIEDGSFASLKDKKPECFKGITQENLDEFLHLVKDEGWYPRQAQAMMREAGTLVEEKKDRAMPAGIKIGSSAHSAGGGKTGRS